MKSSCNKEDTAKKYASISNSGITKCTKTSVGANQYVQPCQQQKKNVESARVDTPINKSDKTSLNIKGNSLLYHSIQPCPFTLLTAVKRKLVLGGNYPTKKTYEPHQINEVPEGTMDLIKPLNVPDLKISPKANYSSRESLLSNEELSRKIEAVQRDEMALRCTDRGPRKLEFSSSSATSILNYENVEPLKVPDISISKKKDLSRDSSKEKENRSKRVKKDDFNMLKNKEEDISKWSKNQRHISRKEIADSIVNRKLKNDCTSAHGPKDSDIILKKLKTKPVSSTGRQDEEKRPKSLNILPGKSKSKFLESKNRTSSSESLHPMDKGSRLHDKILIKEGYKAMIADANDRKYKDDSQLVNAKQSEEQKHKSHSETRLQSRQSKSNPIKPIEVLTRDQNKRNQDKQKLSKTDSKHSSEISEDLTTAVTSMASLVKSQSLSNETSSITSKNKEVDKFSQTSNSRSSEEPKHSDNFQHATTSNQTSGSTLIETKLSQDSSLNEKLMDPTRISFREDSYSSIPEFNDLVTPDVNLMVRSKRRKQIYQSREIESDNLDSKQSQSKSSQVVEEAQLKQLKAEMNLIDSFNESLRQVIDVERSRLVNEDVKRHSVSLQTDHKDSESLDNKDDSKNKIKPPVKVVEVHTQTANDIATQTETTLCQRGVNTSLIYSRDSIDPNDIPHMSLNSEDRYENMDRVEDISLPGKMRTMSEISLHETTSSIKTETGTEISISTRDVTCSFNKYLDLEMAQLIKDERQRYDKIEMLFKSREKTLNDRTKKLVKLEEQKRALRDTGQDSRISSVKKKQRALLLKLQQEKDEMNRLKELHKIASQERKLMLQKQRDMFNPEMSTKNILNKLKRSADSQSPRRLSGPMKGYDIRSNSSISSLVDSDKSLFDRSQFDFKFNLSDIAPHRNDPTSSRLELDSSLKQGLHGADNVDKKLSKLDSSKLHKDSPKLKYDLKTRKFEEKMPKSDLLKLKSSHYDLDTIIKRGTMSLMNNDSHASLSQYEDNDNSISEHMKSESEALIEELAQIWKSQYPESLNLLAASDSVEALHKATSSKRFEKELSKKIQQQQQHVSTDKNAKRKGMKVQKPRTTQIESTSKSEDSQYVEEAFRHHNKRSKIEADQQSDDNYQNSILEELDYNETESSLQALLKHSRFLKERNNKLLQEIVDEKNNAATENSESSLSQKDEEDNTRGGNTSARSQVSLTISHQSSNDSDRSYSRSVVIRSQQDHRHSHSNLKSSKKLEQILNAREATLVSRRNCVEEWIAWHARLREEENRVARMEQAAYKLVSATAKALSHNDTTVSSDTSDVEGRIELLTQKLADRRLEMARLKKEARKQAKQRLRALEANLLNQIKKYDATIVDMRKKLESKKTSSKESDKLAIESKSVVDFKVPEIPIKKIQEIYKSSDLLRSKSDSDIISVRSQGSTDKSKSHDAEKDLTKSKGTGESKPLSTLHTVYDEDHESSEKSDFSAIHSYKTKSNSEEIATQRSVTTEIQEMKRSSSQSSNISEEIPSEAYSVKSQSETIQTAKSEASVSQYITEKIEITKKESTNIEEDLTPVSDDTSLVFSRKLDNIQLHNKELNDDIHNLEHDLKELTEMMSNFSKKSTEKNVKSIDFSEKITKDSEKNNTLDISEEILASGNLVLTDHIDADLQNRVKNILSDVIPETDDLLTSIEEFDPKGKVDQVDKSEMINKSTVSEEISTYLSSHTLQKEPSTGTNFEKENKSATGVTSTVVEEDKENVSPNESHNLVHKISKSSDNVISSQIETEYNSKFEKFSSSHIQESVADESVTLEKDNEISSEQGKSSEVNEKETIEDRLAATKAKYIDTNIFTTEEVSVNHIASLKNEEERTEDFDNAATEDKHVGDKISIEEIPSPQIKKKENEINDIPITTEDDSKVYEKSKNKKLAVKEVNDKILKENVETDNLFVKTANSDNDWTLSDSFEIQPFENKDSKVDELHSETNSNTEDFKKEDQIGTSIMEDSNMFLPRGESTNIQDTFVLKLDESSESRIGIRSEEFNDILEIIERETKNDDLTIKPPAPAILYMEEKSKADTKIDTPIEYDVSVTIKATDEESESIEEEIEGKNDANISEDLISEQTSDDKDTDLPQVEIGMKIEVIEDEDESSKEEVKPNSPEKLSEVEATETIESGGEDRISSDGEQMDNLIEVVEGRLDTVEKITPKKQASVENISSEIIVQKPKTQVTVFLDRTFEVIKDPGYEDISEESLEVSEILDKSDSRFAQKSKKFAKVPEKYVIKSKSDEVLRILDELSHKSTNNFKEDICANEKNESLQIASTVALSEGKDMLPPLLLEKENDIESAKEESMKIVNALKSAEEVSNKELVVPEEVKSSQEDDLQQKQEESQKLASESSEGGGFDTPRGISEIDMDSPRDANEDSRLDVDALDDDLLSGNTLLIQTGQSNDAKTEFRTTPMGVTSEKDIEAMIEKLKASLEQPGLEVAELEAKLLQIENLQIELKIKKLEAEEVSYFMREIPNKPPPPYTPPGAVRLSSAHGSPSPPPAVIPTNVEELTVFTEKATSIIYQAKQAGEDVLALEAPTEICELVKDNSSEALKKDRRIYNTFLFDLCKELIAEMYKSEYEKPGPSWTKPNVKTKPALKAARSLEELHDYVSKEVATLFGFKTKLQRENMVMRWSRKRRDRVDELLAKEAQAEEKEWTKFHHDELAVKNELTVKILDTLIMETTSCVKAAYAKKRKVIND